MLQDRTTSNPLIEVYVEGGCNCIGVGLVDSAFTHLSGIVDTLDQPLYVGLSVSAVGTGDTEIILSFAGTETTQLYSSLSFNTFDTQLKIGSGLTGFISDLKITRGKFTTGDFVAQYTTSNCPEYCPTMCRNDNSCDFLCADGYLQDSSCIILI